MTGVPSGLQNQYKQQPAWVGSIPTYSRHKQEMYPRMHFLFFFKTLLSCVGPALRLTLADPFYRKALTEPGPRLTACRPELKI